jgi:nucleoside-diphosphate-sugar epimerase
VLRLGSVYGVGWEDVIRMDSIVNILTQKAIYEHSITILGGSQWKALISVRDVAGFLHEAILRSITGLYNLSARNYMLNEIGWHVANCIPGTQVIRGLEPPADRNYRIDNGKRLAAFRYDAKYSINEEIFRLKDLFQSIKK